MILGSYVLNKGHDLVTRAGIQSRGWFIKEENLGADDELACHAQTALLAAADAFANGSPDKDIGSRVQSKCGDKCLDAIHTFDLSD